MSSENSDNNSPFSEPSRAPLKWIEFWKQTSINIGFTECRLIPIGAARAVSAKEMLDKSWREYGLGTIEVGVDYITERAQGLENNTQLLTDYLRGKVMHEAGHVIAFSEVSEYRERSGSEGYADYAGVTNLVNDTDEQNRTYASIFAGDWLVIYKGWGVAAMKQIIEREKPESESSIYSAFIDKKYWNFLSQERKKLIYQVGIQMIKDYIAHS